MVYFFIITIILLIYLQYRLYKKIITPFTVMAAPYLIIIPLNNLVIIKYGFYSIDDRVIHMILDGLTCFFIGSIIANNRRRIITEQAVRSQENDVTDFQRYNLSGMLRYGIIVELVLIIIVLSIVRSSGINFFATDANEGYLMQGLKGHLLLSLYPVIPILFYYWLKNRNKLIYLFVSLMGVFLLFLTFVKYHSICILVLTYLFISFKDRKYFKPATIAIVALPIIIFVGNYFLTFFVRGSLQTVGNQFYLYHLWKYIGGALIHDNMIFTVGVNSKWNIFYKIGRLICALPNMFLYPIFGYKPLFNNIESTLLMENVGNMGEKGNTIDFIGYFYPANPTLFGLLSFAVVLMLLGYIVTKNYNNAYLNVNDYSKLLPTLVCIVFFCFFSFFGVYGGLSAPWEIMVWSIIIPKLYDKYSMFCLPILKYTFGKH